MTLHKKAYMIVLHPYLQGWAIWLFFQYAVTGQQNASLLRFVIKATTGLSHHPVASENVPKAAAHQREELDEV